METGAMQRGSEGSGLRLGQRTFVLPTLTTVTQGLEDPLRPRGRLRGEPSKKCAHLAGKRGGSTLREPGRALPAPDHPATFWMVPVPISNSSMAPSSGSV